MKAELVPENGDPPIPITRDLTVVGRREYCDVRIDNPGLSKRHCLLVRTDGLLILRDLASTNGTRVNGQRVRWAALLPNDKVSFGNYKVRIYLGPDEAPSPSERGSTADGLGRPEPPRKFAAAPPAVVQPVPMEFPSPSPLGVPTIGALNLRLDDEKSAENLTVPGTTAPKPVAHENNREILEDDAPPFLIDLD
jgi:pSer/pThr/pTyr-binding forkhead associated (FHA) protein